MPDYEDTIPFVVKMDRRLAQEVERVTDQDPDFVRNLFEYGLLRRGVFDVLSNLARTKALTS